jgi:hypothetical protein
MANQTKTMSLAAIAWAFVLPIGAFGKSQEAKGPAERTGDALGQAVHKAGDAI